MSALNHMLVTRTIPVHVCCYMGSRAPLIIPPRSQHLLTSANSDTDHFGCKPHYKLWQPFQRRGTFIQQHGPSALSRCVMMIMRT
jgi:hypothetical protein